MGLNDLFVINYNLKYKEKIAKIMYVVVWQYITINSGTAVLLVSNVCEIEKRKKIFEK